MKKINYYVKTLSLGNNYIFLTSQRECSYGDGNMINDRPFLNKCDAMDKLGCKFSTFVLQYDIYALLF